MRRAVQLAAAFVGVLISTAGQTQAAVITYEIQDIGTFPTYDVADSGQTYAGTGFVGLYSTLATASPSFVHLFGIEQSDYSKTVLQVDLSALAGATINSAFLNFDLLHGDSAGTQDVTVTSFTSAGDLGYFWTPPDNLGSSVYSVAGTPGNSLNVTAFVQERIAANAGWLGLHLQGSSLYQFTYTWDGFGQHADQANVRLVVDYEPVVTAVPEPSSMALLGIGAVLAGMNAARRRNREQQAA